ncbi:MAG: N-acetyl-gamma-glutamyl-phosphate reductase [Moraxella sp.]|nr:N-acetyl-gamma-glutamyl-phosphate reductase [Moraxella sp.]
MSEVIKVGIVGGTGYTGSELVRLLSMHPKAKLSVLTSRSEAGKSVCEFFPSLRGVTDISFSEPDATALAACDVVFFATPHGVAMEMAGTLLEKGVKVIDLGADFRLQSLAEFEKWYGMPHSCPHVLTQAVYGLSEVQRDKIAKASLIANPGCYPTTVILGLKPFIEQENARGMTLSEGVIIIDAKSGVSGAGRQAKLGLIYGQISENFSAYGVAGHRHHPEISQGVHEILGAKHTHKLRFVPHLVPMIRGMFSTIHLTLNAQGQKEDWQAVFERAYADERFIDVLPKGVLPDTQSVRASNRLRIAVHQDDDILTVMVVQDNLVKGASGQAIQNMNLLFGFDEWLGIDMPPVTP